MIHDCAPRAQDFTNRRARKQGVVNEVIKAKNYTKSKVGACVEHPFLIIKRIFGFAKVRCRRLKKNRERSYVACALANTCLLRRRLLWLT